MINNVATRKQNQSPISTVTVLKSHQLITKTIAPSKAAWSNKLLPFRIKASRINDLISTAHENQCQQNVFRTNQHRIETEMAVLSHG
jgi:hypothetical protein